MPNQSPSGFFLTAADGKSILPPATDHRIPDLQTLFAALQMHYNTRKGCVHLHRCLLLTLRFAPWPMSGRKATRERPAASTPWPDRDRKSTRLNSSHLGISYA